MGFTAAAPAVDVSATSSSFLGNKPVYERSKKDIKRRTCFRWRFTTPRVTEFDDTLDVVVNLLVAFCHIVHMVGDALSVLSPWPSRGMALPRTRELRDLPDFVVKVDACECGGRNGQGAVA